MKTAILFLTVLFLTPKALPCINTTGSGTRFDGESEKMTWATPARELQSSLNQILQNNGEVMEAQLRGATNFNDRSDYAVALMYLGRGEEAVKLLTKLEKEKPGEYYIAANLGTAYELSGNNEEALNWIKEGIRRNPKSHQGTEWLHVKILLAKIAQQQDPSFFKKHSILDLRPDRIGSRIKVDETSFSLNQVTEAIRYQLKERMKFVKPPDAPVGSLLFDYAAIEATTQTMESAKGLLRLAGQYGYPKEPIDTWMKNYDHRIAMAKAKRYTLYGSIGLLGIGLLYSFKKRGVFILN